MKQARLLSGLIVLLAGCGTTAVEEPPTWKVFALERHAAHDGLAVVNQPDGYGIHLFLETDTSDPDICRPRWLPDPARLFNGNGTTPFSSGLATRAEFFEAVERSDVIEALQKELQALCQERAPEARWQWDSPPLTEAEVVPVQLPALEQEDLLTNPVEELKRVKKLLRDQSRDQRKDQQTD